jgi:hypothetical protein
LFPPPPPRSYFSVYLVFPSLAHRWVGYLEEQAVVTYTDALAMLDAGALPAWTSLAAPEIARDYWCLDDDALLRDVLLAVRADEAGHRDVNHGLGGLDQAKDANPFAPVKVGGSAEKVAPKKGGSDK